MEFPYVIRNHYLARRNISTDTAKYVVVMYIQTSMDNGDKKENKLGFGGALFLYRIPTPRNSRCIQFCKYKHSLFKDTNPCSYKAL